jgi:CRP/FNR family transcriptional regulator
MNEPKRKGSDFGDQLAYLSHERDIRPRRRLRLHDFPMWKHLTDTEVDRLLAIVTIRGFRRGELIFDPTDEPNRLYLLQLGRVRTYVLTPTGRKKILHIFAPGDAFGALLLGAVDGTLPWGRSDARRHCLFHGRNQFQKLYVELSQYVSGPV